LSNQPPQEVITHLSRDSVMAELIDTLTLDPIPTQPNLLLSLSRSVIYQQLATSAAKAIFSRFQLILDADPSADRILSLPPQQLHDIGVSKSKAKYLYNIAEFLSENKGIPWDTMLDGEIENLLTSIKGIGSWSAQICLMNYFRRPDIFPVLDLGIQKAMISLYQLDLQGQQLKEKMLLLSKQWIPYRSTASLYLWQWKRNEK
jgi:DNA-3-methyladenine glycosylase II